MQVSSEKMEGSRVALSIEADTGEMESALDAAYHRLVGRTTVPGFRKGKAPRSMLERYLGRPALVRDACERLMAQLYDQAVKEQGIDAISQPELEITQLEPLVFTANVTVRPTVELGDYRSIRVAPEPVDVTGEQVDEAIEYLRHLHASWEPVERPTQADDLITVDIEGVVDGRKVIDEKAQEYRLVAGQALPLPGFAEELLGVERGDQRQFTLSFPMDYRADEVRGKECDFTVRVVEIKEEVLPELNDEFAKSFGRGLDTMVSLRERVATDTRERAEAAARRAREEKALEAIVDLADFELPTLLVEQEMDRLAHEREGALGRNAPRTHEHAHEDGHSSQERREVLRPHAVALVSRSLVLAKLCEVEGIAVTAADVDAEVARLVQGAGEKGDEVARLFSPPAARASLARGLLTQKAVHRLLEIASGGVSEAPSPNAPGEADQGREGTDEHQEDCQ